MDWEKVKTWLKALVAVLAVGVIAWTVFHKVTDAKVTFGQVEELDRKQ